MIKLSDIPLDKKYKHVTHYGLLSQSEAVAQVCLWSGGTYVCDDKPWRTNVTERDSSAAFSFTLGSLSPAVASAIAVLKLAPDRKFVKGVGFRSGTVFYYLVVEGENETNICRL